MFSRNNLKQYQKYANHQQRWALRKYSFGVASVMVGMTLGLLGGTQVAAADQEQPGPVAMLNDSPSTVDKQTVPMGTASNPTNSIPDNVPVTTNDELVTDHPTVKARMMVSLVDDITSQTISTVNLAGQPGSTIDFTIAEDQITKYTQAGYEVVKHDLPTGRTNYDSIDDSKIVSQAYTVHLTHGTVTIDVDNPQLPGTPINPQDPASPIYTEEQANVDADYLLLVKYRGASKNPPTILQNSRWTRSVMIDKVTGKTLSTTPWITPDSYNTVKTPIVPGYYADQAQVVENLIPENQTYTVNYQPVGKMIIQDAAGHRFPNQPDVVYANDPLDATKVLANQPVPVIIGYTPAITVVTPIQPGEDTIVTYTPRLVADEVHTSQTIRYVGAGKVTPQPDVQLFTFVGQRNELTGETTWEVDDHTFGKVTTPVIIGYYADLAVAGGETVTPADSQRDITVTYTPVGMMVPRDEYGHEIPECPGMPYENDPDDPTKVLTMQLVPMIPGYTATVKTVTPDHPGKDTIVTYVKQVTLGPNEPGTDAESQVTPEETPESMPKEKPSEPEASTPSLEIPKVDAEPQVIPEETPGATPQSMPEVKPSEPESPTPSPETPKADAEPQVMPEETPESTPESRPSEPESPTPSPETPKVDAEPQVMPEETPGATPQSTPEVKPSNPELSTPSPETPKADTEPQVIPNDSTEKIQVIERSNGNDKSQKKIQARMKNHAFNKSMQGKDLPQTGNEIPNHLIGLGLLTVSLMMFGFKRKKQN